MLRCADEAFDPAAVQREPSVLGVWRVYRTSGAEGAAASGVPSPRDVTMDCGETEAALGLAFTPMALAVPLCIADIRRIRGAADADKSSAPQTEK